MGSIGGISAFGSQAVNRFQKSNMPKSLTALEAAEQVRLGPIGKTEQQIHLEKAKEMAEAGSAKESLHEKVTRQAAENPEKTNLHLALIEKKNSQPFDPMEALAKGGDDPLSVKQKSSTDGIGSDELALAGSKRNAKVAQANSKASLENSQRFGSAFDPGSSSNMSKSFFSGAKDVSGYDPNGNAVKSGGKPVGGVLNVMA